jgi:hypothetical protein
MQNEYINFIKNTHRDINIVTLFLSPYEVKGIEKIKDISELLFS